MGFRTKSITRGNQGHFKIRESIHQETIILNLFVPRNIYLDQMLESKTKRIKERHSQ